MKPPALKPGDTIGVMAPSSYVDDADIEKSKALLEKKGYNVFIHPQTRKREQQSAGSHEQKSLALQELWRREDIKAIWAAGGGNRALHFLDLIDFKHLKTRPKIFIGFSDVTALLNAIYAHTHITVFHGPVFKNLSTYKECDHLFALLAGEISKYPMDTAKIIHAGTTEGPLIGGNLSLFQYLPQTLPGKFWQDSLLFLEDCNEELNKIDRMFLHLKRLGILNDINGLILGNFTNMQDTGRPFGYTLEDIVREHTDGLDIPVVMDAPFGHGAALYTFPIGTNAILNTAAMSLNLKEPAVQ